MDGSIPRWTVASQDVIRWPSPDMTVTCDPAVCRWLNRVHLSSPSARPCVVPVVFWCVFVVRLVTMSNRRPQPPQLAEVLFLAALSVVEETASCYIPEYRPTVSRIGAHLCQGRRRRDLGRPEQLNGTKRPSTEGLTPTDANFNCQTQYALEQSSSYQSWQSADLSTCVNNSQESVRLSLTAVVVLLIVV